VAQGYPVRAEGHLLVLTGDELKWLHRLLLQTNEDVYQASENDETVEMVEQTHLSQTTIKALLDAMGACGECWELHDPFTTCGEYATAMAAEEGTTFTA